MVWLLALYAAHSVLVLALALRSVYRPTNALAWVICCMFIPVIGLILYVVLARPVSIRRARLADDSSEESLALLSTPANSALRGLVGVEQAMSKLSGGTATHGTVRILPNGEETYAALFEALESAASSITAEYYIIRNDPVGQTFLSILARKAAAGVSVRLLVDGIGSLGVVRSQLPKLAGVGVDCRVVFPLQFPWLRPGINHRDHCKIVVIDGSIGYIGGINIGLEYTGHKPGVGAWRDTHAQVTGQAVQGLARVFELNWSVGRQVSAGRSSNRTQADRVQLLNGIPDYRPPTSRQADAIPALMQTVESGPDRPVRTVQALYFMCLTQAKRTVDMVTPYFVPDTDLTMAMKLAVARGVRVRLLVPEHCDHRVVGLAARTFFAELAKAGVELWLYGAQLLHAKVVVVDGALSVLGASNFDLRSFRLNYEVCQVVYGEAAAEELTKQFEADLADAHHVSVEEIQALLPVGILERGARLLAPLL
ncbi:cardiolipin synthase [Alicyclobacillus sp. ALC3]|nr:cardiolipin synthase [Alicyclobacillus sp. ALC3]